MSWSHFTLFIETKLSSYAPGSPTKWYPARPRDPGSFRSEGPKGVKIGKPQSEHLFSGMPRIAAGSKPCWHLRSAPKADVIIYQLSIVHHARMAVSGYRG